MTHGPSLPDATLCNWHRVTEAEWECFAEDGYVFARVRKLGRYWHSTCGDVRVKSLASARSSVETAIKARMDRRVLGER